VFHVAHWNNSLWIDILLHSDKLSCFRACLEDILSQQVIALTPYCWVLNEKATHTNFIAFGLTRPGLEPTIRSMPLETSVLTITPLETSVLTITPLETSVLTITPLETSVLTVTLLETSVLTSTPPMRFKCTNTFFVDKFSAMLYGQCNRYEKFIYNNKLQVFPEEKKVGIYQRG
jgi:hypothetical protein